jgi:hypothetical protein
MFFTNGSVFPAECRDKLFNGRFNAEFVFHIPTKVEEEKMFCGAIMGSICPRAFE